MTGELTGRLLIGGKLVPGCVRHAGGRITAVETAGGLGGPDLPVVAPGLVDLHVHGFGGFDPLEDLGGLARALARAGTTAFLPTLFPAEPERLGADAARVWGERKEAGPEPSARVLGLHLEGPFVNPEKAGGLPRDQLALPSPAALRGILGDSSGDARGIRQMTLAPELSGSNELVAELVRSGVRVSLGHSQASAAETRRAADLGARGATHLFNAMGPWHHREESLASYALAEDELVAEIIGDLVHVGVQAFRVALRARGPGGLALVSDALRGAGTGCATFESHGRRCSVRNGAIWIDSDDPGVPPRLTGAEACQLEAIRRLVRSGVVELEAALAMASETPARALGLADELGRLAEGARADLIVLDPRTLALRAAFIAGEPVWS